MKLPEPVGLGYALNVVVNAGTPSMAETKTVIVQCNVYTEDQYKQGQRDALEAAAETCGLFDAVDPKYIAAAIRNLKKEIV
jgi:hypothetical protein